MRRRHNVTLMFSSDEHDAVFYTIGAHIIILLIFRFCTDVRTVFEDIIEFYAVPSHFSPLTCHLFRRCHMRFIR